MPQREIPLVSDQIYHVFNRAISSIPIFHQQDDYNIFMEKIAYYQHKKPAVRYSKFKKLSIKNRYKILLKSATKKDEHIDIIAYCLMPNHFHLLLKQKEDNGIKEFIRILCNSHSKYNNIKYKRKGSLFESRFK